MKPATSNLDCSCGLPRPIIKSHKKKSGCCPGLGKLPEIRGFPFNISSTAEASDFKFSIQFGFFTTHHKITPKKKSGRGNGVGELPKIWGSLLIFLQRLKVVTSRLAGR